MKKNKISTHAFCRIKERSDFYKKDIESLLNFIIKNGVTFDDVPIENGWLRKYMAIKHWKAHTTIHKYYFEDYIYIINCRQRNLISFIPVRPVYKNTLDELLKRKIEVNKQKKTEKRRKNKQIYNFFPKNSEILT